MISILFNESLSIRRGNAFDVVNDEYFHRQFLRSQSEPQLLLDRLGQNGGHVFGLERATWYVARDVESEIIAIFEAGHIYHGGPH